MRPYPSGVIYVSKARKYPKIILDNFEYRIAKQETKKTTWKCVSCDKMRCRGRIVTFGQTVKILYEHHNHPAPSLDLSPLTPQPVKVIKMTDNSVCLV
nr:unnamed protein product [Callosobruchus analis]